MNKKSIISFRSLIQLVFLLLTAAFVYSPYLFNRGSKAESLCPLGALESLPQLVAGTNLLNHINKSNVVLLAAVIVITLLFGRLFCSWICPLGTLQEWFGNIGRRLKLTVEIAEKLEAVLTKVKYLILLLILFGTYTTATLVFRSYDPFYALLHLANPALTGAFVIFAAVLLGSIFIPRIWCRFLCPLGALINILSLAGLIKPYRNENKCINCGLCDKACPVNIKASKAGVLKAGSCNHCLDCMDACPKKGALDFKTPFTPSNELQGVDKNA